MKCTAIVVYEFINDSRVWVGNLLWETSHTVVQLDVRSRYEYRNLPSSDNMQG